MSASEKSVWAAGNRGFAQRLRVAMGPKAILVADNGSHTVTADLTAKTKGSRIDVFVGQDRAVSGDILTVDAVSSTPVTRSDPPGPPHRISVPHPAGR